MKFIVKENGSNYYLSNEGMGGFLTPPGNAENKFSIVEKRDGYEVGRYSLSGAVEERYLPAEVRFTAKQYLKQHLGEVTEEYIQQVYKYFKNCYSPDGIDRNVSNCIIDNTNLKYPAEYHLGYLLIKKYDENHSPRIDLF